MVSNPVAAEAAGTDAQADDDVGPVVEVAEAEVEERLDRVFHALAHSARRAMIARLARGESTVGELAAPFGMSLPAVTKHIQVLEDAGLIRRWREGRTKVCGLESSPLVEIVQWIRGHDDFWERRLDSLELMFQIDGEDEPPAEHAPAALAPGEHAAPEPSRAPNPVPKPGPDKPGGGKKRAAAR